jgi:ubiquinone/menaquinone biosynthesis C-methylase UbiE
MSSVEAMFCRSTPWRAVARHAVLPWVLHGSFVGPEILEIGGGSGAMAYELLRRQPTARLTLADVDPNMLDAASRRLASFGDRARPTMSDATGLDEFADQSFDTVCSWLMLHHTIKWEAVLAESARVLRPGGTLAGYDLVDTPVARAVHRVDGSEHRLLRPDALEAGLERSGFEASRVELALGGLVMRFEARRPSSSI